MLGELVSMGDEKVLHTVHGHICGRCQDVSASSLRVAAGSPGRLHSSDQYWEQKKQKRVETTVKTEGLTTFVHVVGLKDGEYIHTNYPLR